MNVAPIKTTRDYRRALKEIEGLMQARRGTPVGVCLPAGRTVSLVATGP